MAKTLEKVTKEYRALSSKLDEVVQQVQSIGKNRTDLERLADEYVRGAAEAAIALKSKGHTGKTFDDFRDESEVKKLFKLWTKQQSTAAQLVPAAKTASKEYPALMAKLNAMIKELTDEVANREKKANRAVFKIKSESLPDLKKLLTEVKNKVAGLVDDEFEEDAQSLPGTVAQPFPSFEEAFEKELKKAPAARQSSELFEMGKGAKNIRVQVKYLREGRQMESAIKKLCQQALKAANEGSSPKPFLDQAVKIYKEMNKVAKIQERAKKMEPWQLKTPDGKKVHDSAVAYIQMSKQTLALLTQTTSSTMPALKTASSSTAPVKKKAPPVPARKDKGKEKIDV